MALVVFAAVARPMVEYLAVLICQQQEADSVLPVCWWTLLAKTHSPAWPPAGFTDTESEAPSLSS